MSAAVHNILLLVYESLLNVVKNDDGVTTTRCSLVAFTNVTENIDCNWEIMRTAVAKYGVANMCVRLLCTSCGLREPILPENSDEKNHRRIVAKNRREYPSISCEKPRLTVHVTADITR